MFILQNLTAYTTKEIKVLRPNQRNCNNTNLPLKWKDVAMCEDLESLKEYLVNENFRIIKKENLETVLTYAEYSVLK